MIAVNRSRQIRRQSCRRVQQGQRVKNVGECLWRDCSSGIIYAIVGVGKKQFKKSLRTTNVVVARQRLAEFRLSLSRQPVAEPAPVIAPTISATPQSLEPSKLSFAEVAERWLAAKYPSGNERRAHSIQVISATLGAELIGDITRLDCERWAAEHVKSISQRTGKPISSRTYNLDCETLKGVFGYAVLHNLIAASPADALERRTVRYPEVKVPSRSEFCAILATMRSRKESGKPPALDAACLIEGIAYLGLRQGEANALKWQDVDFECKLVRIAGTKTANARRVVPLFAPAARLLGEMKRQQQPKPTDFVFKVKTAKTPLETACRILGLPKFHHYSFRHLCATMLLEQGCSFKFIGKVLGHSELSGGSLAAKTYTHLRADFVSDETARVQWDAAAMATFPSAASSSS